MEQINKLNSLEGFKHSQILLKYSFKKQTNQGLENQEQTCLGLGFFISKEGIHERILTIPQTLRL